MKQLEQVVLGWDELEAVRLADLEGLDHERSGKLMGVSRQTFGRIVARARAKTAEALLAGKALVIEEGNVAMTGVDARHFECDQCRKPFEEPFGTGRPEACPHCGSESLKRVAEERGSGPGRGRGHGGPCTGRSRRTRRGES
jgi:predicted DNA-binding protein (UPF0251 family)